MDISKRFYEGRKTVRSAPRERRGRARYREALANCIRLLEAAGGLGSIGRPDAHLIRVAERLEEFLQTFLELLDRGDENLLTWWMREYGLPLFDTKVERRCPYFPEWEAPTTLADLDALEARLTRTQARGKLSFS